MEDQKKETQEDSSNKIEILKNKFDLIRNNWSEKLTTHLDSFTNISDLTNIQHISSGSEFSAILSILFRSKHF